MMAHASTSGEGDDREIPAVDMSKAARPSRAPAGGDRPARLVRRGRPEGTREADTSDSDGPIVRLFVGAGRLAGVRPNDLVGAFTGEAGVPSRALGAIDIADKFSLVEVPEALADRIILAMRSATIRGKKVQVRRERSHPA